MVHNYTQQIKKHTEQGTMRGKTLRESAMSMLSSNQRPFTDEKGRARLDVEKVMRDGLSSKGDGFVRVQQDSSKVGGFGTQGNNTGMNSSKKQSFV